MESNGAERPFFQRNSGHAGLLLLFLGQQAEQLALTALAAGVGDLHVGTNPLEQLTQPPVSFTEPVLLVARARQHTKAVGLQVDTDQECVLGVVDLPAPDGLHQAALHDTPVDAYLHAAGLHVAQIVVVVFHAGLDAAVLAADLHRAGAQVIILLRDNHPGATVPLGHQRLENLPIGMTVLDRDKLDPSLSVLQDIRVDVTQMLLQNRQLLVKSQLLIGIGIQRIENIHRAGEVDDRPGPAEAADPAVMVLSVAAEAVRSMHLAVPIQLRILLGAGGDLPIAALVLHIGKRMLEAEAMLVQGRLLPRLTGQAQSVVQVLDAGAAVLDGDVRHAVHGRDLDADNTVERAVRQVAVEVGDGVIAKLADGLRQVVEVAAQVLPERGGDGGAVVFKHSNHSHKNDPPVHKSSGQNPDGAAPPGRGCLQNGRKRPPHTRCGGRGGSCPAW